MKNILAILCLALIYSPASAQSAGMTTRWTAGVSAKTAWRDYPRPQLVRDSWVNLNGEWDYAIRAKTEPAPATYDGKILVPFCVESRLSGVGKPVTPEQKLWYKRSFTLPGNRKDTRQLLHFDAVDWETTVWVNGRQAAMHRGGSDAFTIDITPFMKPGAQELVISVWDPSDTGTQPRGKQTLNPRGIWYTAVTGIWQTVWLEQVNANHVETFLPEADIDKNLVRFKNSVAGSTEGLLLDVIVSQNGKPVARAHGRAGADLVVAIHRPQLWSPANPSLYQVKAKLTDGKRTFDVFSSYFAMRKISVGDDGHGTLRLLLNNKPQFQFGTLDQGWWPDGLLTPPSPNAMLYDMQQLKRMGFNMLRKHIKVEPARYYYQADSIGMLIWQDMPSGFAEGAREQTVAPGAADDWKRPAASAAQFEKEWATIMEQRRFFPSIVVWVPFNEGWGQYDTRRIAEWTRRNDPLRLVNAASGWTDRGAGAFYDAHQYPGPAMELNADNPGRVMVLGEFGGLGWPVAGHLWNPGMRNWGYRTYLTQDELKKQYASLVDNLAPMVSNGLSAAIYTQTTDVEGEVNGLMTYDREVTKMEPAWMSALHAPLYAEPTKAVTVIPVGGSIDLKKGPNAPVQKEFTLTSGEARLQLRLVANADLKIILNGKEVLSKYVNARQHFDEINLSAYKGLLKNGVNTIRIEFTDVKSESPFDMGLYRF